ncbi:MAG: type II toxin-antitoxin system RelE/ParE family toxin [Candidatus Falkowbacteria bacterium]
MNQTIPKPIIWMGDTKKILTGFTKELRRCFGYALDEVQKGITPSNAKLLRGIGSSVFEIVEDYFGDTYRAIYTAKLSNNVYVLHVFQKKSKKGIKTPLRDINLIKERLKQAEKLVCEK